MGLEQFVRRISPVSLGLLVHKLQAQGHTALVAMVDGSLVMPGSTLPTDWTDVRLRTEAGTLTLSQREGGVAVTVFGNAPRELVDLQARIVELLGEAPA
jgi:hypothetical protein